MRVNKRKLYSSVTKYVNANLDLKFIAWWDSHFDTPVSVIRGRKATPTN